MAKTSITQSAQAFSSKREYQVSVTIQGNITAMRYRNDVIRSVLLHIRWHGITHHVTRLEEH